MSNEDLGGPERGPVSLTAREIESVNVECSKLAGDQNLRFALCT